MHFSRVQLSRAGTPRTPQIAFTIGARDVRALCKRIKRDGLFSGFGAVKGIGLSNTLVLGRRFAWDGILAEANRSFARELLKNRSAAITTRAVTDTAGSSLEFLEAGQNSSAFSRRKMARWGRVKASCSVNTDSLLD